jgi:dethiobiotin synthetase
MAKRIFITATNTNIGKTYTTKLLLKEFALRGFRVGVIKPIETGVISNIYLDGDELLTTIKTFNESMSKISVEDIVPISYNLPSAPYIASNRKKLDLNKIDNAIKKLESLCDILLIEGAGGLYVPIDEKYMMIDLIKHFNANVLLVTHCSLGCINDTLLSEEALKNKKIKHITAFNCKDDNKDFSKISQPYFINTRDKILKVDKNIDTICDVLYNL